MGLNDGAPYAGHSGSIWLNPSGGSPPDSGDLLANVTGWTATDDATEIDATDFDSNDRSQVLGKQGMEFSATVQRAAGTPLLRPGTYQSVWIFDDTTATPGTISCDITINQISNPRTIDGLAQYSISAKSSGPVNIQEPAA